MKNLAVILLFILGATMAIEAQQTQAVGSRATTEIIASSLNSVVKGAPFSAEAISESVQTLADGNRITHSNTTRMFRDSEGRFRREGDSTIGGAGSGTFVYSGAIAGFGFQDTISISDPVSNVRYLLNPTTKTARRVSTLPRIGEGTLVLNNQLLSATLRKEVEVSAMKKAQTVLLPAQTITTAVGEGSAVATIVTDGGNGRGFSSAGKTESLGTRDFEGVMAEGTRTITTIQAGAIGNERPIEIVYERWYSKELQLIVYSLRSDPRFGEQTYRLTNINRSEPDRSLFIPSADYKIVSEQTFNVVRTKPREEK